MSFKSAQATAKYLKECSFEIVAVRQNLAKVSLNAFPLKLIEPKLKLFLHCTLKLLNITDLFAPANYTHIKMKRDAEKYCMKL